MSSRPASVTTVVMLTWVAALLNVLGGLAMLFNWFGFADKSGYEVPVQRGIGVGWIILGLVLAFAASRLGKGGSIMRVLVSAVLLLRGLGGASELASGGAAQQVAAVISILFAVVGLALLWNAKASEFFRSN